MDSWIALIAKKPEEGDYIKPSKSNKERGTKQKQKNENKKLPRLDAADGSCWMLLDVGLRSSSSQGQLKFKRHLRKLR